MERAEFLAISPAELNGLLQWVGRREEVRDRKRLLPPAMVQAAIYNANNDWEKRPEGWSAVDFLPRTAEEVAQQESVAERPPTEEEMAEYKARLGVPAFAAGDKKC